MCVSEWVDEVVLVCGLVGWWAGFNASQSTVSRFKVCVVRLRDCRNFETQILRLTPTIHYPENKTWT